MFACGGIRSMTVISLIRYCQGGSVAKTQFICSEAKNGIAEPATAQRCPQECRIGLHPVDRRRYGRALARRADAPERLAFCSTAPAGVNCGNRLL